MIELPTLRRKPDACRGCIGWNWNNGYGYTLNEGYSRIPLLVVAEAPGENEEEEGRPLSPNGASGKIFRRALRELGIPPGELTITNILRCRPPNNELRGMPYEREAIDHCSRYMDRSVQMSEPKMILALGDTPLRELAAERHGTVTAMRGFVLPGKYEGIPVISTYHPSYIARGAWQLYGAFKHDIATAARFAVKGVPAQKETNYVLNPTVADVQSFVGLLRTSPRLPISYDIETAHILGESEPDDWRQKRIVQIQFSIRTASAIVLPLRTEEQRAVYGPLARTILALPNPKWGWNSRLSDDLAIRALGWELNGELHDLMNAWGHLQPSFWGGKDDRDTDKGVPSRLMGLQSCASFYCPEVGPWKHLGGPEHLALYGAMDADYTYRVGEGIMESLTAQGLMAGYRSHKLDLRPVLDYLGEVGLPVDRDKQAALRTYVVGELKSIQKRIQEQVPADILSLHPKDGWKGAPASIATVDGQVYKLSDYIKSGQWHRDNPPYVLMGDPAKAATRKGKPTEGYLIWHRFVNASGEDEKRWCIQRLFNPHGSSPNTKAYIRHMGYRMPTRIDDPEAETTGKSELKKLADETGDPVLQLIYDWRDLAKTGLDYTAGAWVPGEDGRVHATFKWGTASGQLVATQPAVMTYPEHSEIAKRAKEAIAAQPGHMLVKVDMRGFHSRMIGWLAGDAAYYKLADYDVHSFISAHFLHLHDAPYLLDMDEDELRGALDAIKDEHKHTRNFKVKRTVHGRQFNMGVNKLYTMHAQNFDPPESAMPELVGPEKWFSKDRKWQMDEIARWGRREAKTLFDLFDRLFPRTFVSYPAIIAEQVRNVTKCRLVSPFGHIRYFWDFDKEQSTAFGPSNCAHCHIQAALVRLHHSGALQKYEAINFTHDALWNHPRIELVAEAINAVQTEFNRPSDVLVSSPLGPFQCNSDAEVGPDLAHMVTWKGSMAQAEEDIKRLLAKEGRT